MQEEVPAIKPRNQRRDNGAQLELLTCTAAVVSSNSYRLVRRCTERPMFFLMTTPDTEMWDSGNGCLYMCTTAVALILGSVERPLGTRPCRPWHLSVYAMHVSPMFTTVRMAFEAIMSMLDDIAYTFFDRRFAVDCVGAASEQPVLVPDDCITPSIRRAMRTLLLPCDDVPLGVRKLYHYMLAYRINSCNMQSLRATIGRLLRSPVPGEGVPLSEGLGTIRGFGVNEGPALFYRDKSASLMVCLGPKWTKQDTRDVQIQMRDSTPDMFKIGRPMHDMLASYGFPVQDAEQDQHGPVQ